jgi:hypothetical protein
LRAYAYTCDWRLTDVVGDIGARRLLLHSDLSQDGKAQGVASAACPGFREKSCCLTWGG